MCEYDYSLPSVVLIYYYIVLKIELMIYFPSVVLIYRCMTFMHTRVGIELQRHV